MQIGPMESWKMTASSRAGTSMDYPKGYLDQEYRGFRIRYAKGAFDLPDNVELDCTLVAVSKEAVRALSLTGGMPPAGWEIAPDDSFEAFIERSKSAIDEMLLKAASAPVAYHVHRGHSFAVTAVQGRHALWAWTSLVLSEKDGTIRAGTEPEEPNARAAGQTWGKARIDQLIGDGELIDLTPR
jgi:hypothetical protein